MTRLVIEQGRMAPSIAMLARGGKPAVAASVRAFNQRGKEGRGLDSRGICPSWQLWQPAEDQGHRSPLSPLAGTFYSVHVRPSLDVALG